MVLDLIVSNSVITLRKENTETICAIYFTN